MAPARPFPAAQTIAVTSRSQVTESAARVLDAVLRAGVARSGAPPDARLVICFATQAKQAPIEDDVARENAKREHGR